MVIRRSVTDLTYLRDFGQRYRIRMRSLHASRERGPEVEAHPLHEGGGEARGEWGIAFARPEGGPPVLRSDPHHPFKISKRWIPFPFQTIRWA